MLTIYIHFLLPETHVGYEYWQQPMRDSTPFVRYVQTKRVSLAGHVGVGVEGSHAAVPGDDQFHSLSSSTLTLPPMEPYGPITRYFDVFWRGTESCEWSVSPEAKWIKLSPSSGTVGPESPDTRVYVSIDWEAIPEDFEDGTEMYINVTTPCREYWTYAYREPKIMVPVTVKNVPEDFDEGFVEADGHVSIEGPHYQRVINGTNEELYYHTFTNYGRTLGGVGLFPLGIEKATLEEAPAIEYDMYFFTNHSAANVTVWVSPSHNYLGDADALEYGIALFPAGEEPSEMDMKQPVSGVEGTNMPDGWEDSVADSVWGQHSGDMTTSTFEVPKAGAYTIRIKALLPSLIVQKIIVDLGGVRESYLGPPESFLVGRDTLGEHDQTSFIGNVDKAKDAAEGTTDDGPDNSATSFAPSGMAMVAAVVCAMMLF